jgi:proton-translocating NADH-quinone oxidoreductase chain L
MVAPHAYWIPLLPLLAFVFILLAGQLMQWAWGVIRIGDELAFRVSVLMVGGSWLLSLLLLGEVLSRGPGWAYHASYPWFQAGLLHVRFGWLADSLAAIMLVVISTVALMVQIYSRGYMAGDWLFPRFYGYLSLFTAAMLALVLANNLLELFIAWEVMGLASYLLIGYWFEKPAAMRAAKKAFVVTRIGDTGLFFGMVLLVGLTGTMDFMGLVVAQPDGQLPPVTHGWISSLAVSAGPAILQKTSPVFGTVVAGSTLLGIAALLIFCGAIGKSAQFPLHVWLPDAMEGPTPVSALIHAATMVAAGVYLVARMYPVFDYGGTVTFLGTDFRPLGLVALVGTITALLGAFIALTQPDIKRILAYSTISQLGYMLAGLGCGGMVLAPDGHGPELLKLGFTAGMFHLVTHAFFKGLLFLGAGSVIHGTGTQDIWEMGGLRRRMPVTFKTYLCGAAALVGLPFVASGYYSKDLILDAAWEFSPAIFWVLLFTAGLTAFYMTRQVMLVFSGAWSGPPELQEHGHTEPLADPYGSLHAEDVTHVGHEQEEQPFPGAGHGLGGHLETERQRDGETERQRDREWESGRVGDTGIIEEAGPDAANSEEAKEPEAHEERHPEGTRPHESPRSMTGPLILLAGLALLTGFAGLPNWPVIPEPLRVGIYPYLRYSRPGMETALEPHINWVVFLLGLIVPVAGIGLGYLAYRGRQFNPMRGVRLTPFHRFVYGLSYNKLYFDELYWLVLVKGLFLVTRTLDFIDRWIVDGTVRLAALLGVWFSQLWEFVDRTVVDGIVNGSARFSRLLGNGLRVLQTGQIQNYVLVAFVGVVVMIWMLVFGMGR